MVHESTIKATFNTITISSKQISKIAKNLADVRFGLLIRRLMFPDATFQNFSIYDWKLLRKER